MTMVLECRSFVATPLAEGKIKLEVAGAITPHTPAEKSYTASEAVQRLSELMGKDIRRSNLPYWRDSLGLPYKKMGPRKFLYIESDLARWVRGRTML